MRERKAAAYAFLKGLEATLNPSLPSTADLRTQMKLLAAEARGPSTIRENVFLYNYILRSTANYVRGICQLSQDEAERAILCEYHATTMKSANPFRRSGYPFGKAPDLNVRKVMASWRKPRTNYPINQAYPDFAFAPPIPHRIVFDTKYFDLQSEAAAEKTLVDGVYEAAHYRGLPQTASSSATDPGWSYDFGCLVACDASETGSLKEAWNSVVNRTPFWDGANVFVMILRNDG